MPIDRSELLDFLRQGLPTPMTKAHRKRTLQQFVFEYGWWYAPIELPKRFRLGMSSECHKNAVDLMLSDESPIYCEGYALFESGTSPVIHAWVTDGKGRAIDNTWPHPGVAYAGVPFRSLFVSMTALKNRATISLLDSRQATCPLKGALGDRPDEWLMAKGRGIRRVDESQ
jgi:hypothetical protein